MPRSSGACRDPLRRLQHANHALVLRVQFLLQQDVRVEAVEVLGPGVCQLNRAAGGPELAPVLDVVGPGDLPEIVVLADHLPDDIVGDPRLIFGGRRHDHVGADLTLEVGAVQHHPGRQRGLRVLPWDPHPHGAGPPQPRCLLPEAEDAGDEPALHRLQDDRAGEGLHVRELLDEVAHVDHVLVRPDVIGPPGQRLRPHVEEALAALLLFLARRHATGGDRLAIPDGHADVIRERLTLDLDRTESPISDSSRNLFARTC